MIDALVVGAGEADMAQLKTLADRCGFIICADGGYDYAAACGVTPDCVIGDFDSVRTEILPQIQRIAFPARKDDTDLILALRHCAQLGIRRVFAVGCLGGKRLDHSIASVQSMLFAEDCGVSLTLLAAGTRVELLKTGVHTVERNCWLHLSLFCLDRESTVVISGCEYNGEIHFSPRFPLGAGNSIVSGEAVLNVAGSVVMVLTES